MALLLDNDVVHKLAQLDLLMDASKLLRKEFGGLKILDTLKFKFCPKPEDTAKRAKAEKKYGVVVVKRIDDFLHSGISEISQAVQDTDLMNAMISDEDLDTGEMQLLQALFDEKEQLLFTGDKRFLKALAETELLSDRLTDIQEKFVCLEQLMCFLIKNLSFTVINGKFVGAVNSQTPLLDTTLRVCFGSKRENAIENEVIENLVNEIGHLKKQTKNLLTNEGKFN
ncbi:MAG: hypothetical protein PHH59_11670 [Methylovulum sp.]|uniref:hypothetical protein n=1 Tax=Methylovulum sp. TaxID=1916980 RepID=UPI002634A2AB|nr:hypothetical protein [Methylovulum sp.]MDD2724664.1 hypothetical protein [Methylovulum sp.]MDD5123491.1 hypothetical protein [Methylovulum sp.]